MLILIGSNKGGCGKSTIAVNLAAAYSLEGLSVCVIDADKQGTSYRWVKDRSERWETQAKEYIHTCKMSGKIHEQIKFESQNHDVTIVDVAGSNSIELVTALMTADICITPAQCSQFDLDTLAELRQQYEHACIINPKLKILIYQNMANTNHFVVDTERKEFMEYLADFPEFTVLKSRQFYRRIYQTTTAEGLSVLEGDNQDAKSEILKLVANIEEITNAKA